MEYATIGNTDIQVSKLCLGCMSFGDGSTHSWALDEQASDRIIHHALDVGINFFDTANVYFNPGRLSKEAINREIDGTLKRLGTDYLDLYIIHRFDYDTPIEEAMGALNDLVKAGKVRALGASAMYGYQFYNMQQVAKDHGWTPFSAMENHYNLLYREDEHELIPICKQFNVSLMPYSSLASGHLTRPTWNSDSKRSHDDPAARGKYDHMEETDLPIVKRVAELADRYQVKMADVALAW
ncbi:aldo/keto reductase [Limosilactobacillus fermentum]|nr:aldo/keto reductase [Limosilactobacillus fermentum]